MEELHLRERALKSLLKKRVVKTQSIIKKAIQNENVTSTSVPGKGSQKVEAIEEKQEDKPKKKAFRSKSVIQSTELRNFIDNPAMEAVVKSKQTEENVENFVASDDELSLCASDHENDDNVQCNVISSCFDQENGNAVDEKLVPPPKDTDNNETSSPKDSMRNELSQEPALNEAEQTEVIKSDGKPAVDSVNKDGDQIISNLDSASSSLHDIDAGSSSSQVTEILDEGGCSTTHAVIDEEVAGPSGYTSKNIHQSGSESSSDSVVEIDAPQGRFPRTLSLITDSDESEAGVLQSGKQKLRKKKKKKRTVKEKLSKQEGLMDEREDLQDLNCSICLGPFEDRTFLKHSTHSFCYICIMQWSELSRLCPLCKKHFKTLIHHVTKELDYEEYNYPEETEKPPEKRSNEFSENMDDGRRFRYASTIVDHEVWRTRREERQRIESEQTQSRQQRKISRRLRWSATKDRRKAIYRMKMVVKEVKQRGKSLTRDISPEFFKRNPAIKHRLVPWLLRDLNALLGNDDEMIRFVMSLILNLISKVSMESGEFKEQLRGFLFEETDHFVDELVSFAKSPFDIRGYDSHVVYDVPPPVIEIEDREDTMENKILHEVFIGDEAQSILTNQYVASGEESSSNNTDVEESNNSNQPTTLEGKNEQQEQQSREEESERADETEEKQEGENPVSIEASFGTSKKKKKKHKKRKKQLQNESKNEYANEIPEVIDLENDTENNKKRFKKKKKRKHEKRDKPDQTEIGSGKELLDTPHKKKKHDKHNVDFHSDHSSENETESGNRGTSCKEDEHRHDVVEIESSHSEIENESQNKSNNQKKLKKKKKKKRKSLRNENNENDVSVLLSRYLKNSNKDYNGFETAQQLHNYLHTQGNKHKNSQKDIIKELLSIEKSMLRNQRKKEMNRLQNKQRHLEDQRSKRRRQGDEEYNENDDVIYEIDDQLEKLSRKLKKGK
uniref:RING-type E3 ubiquitin transferase n=1 Tax=Clytia hemisphaerica TaxID=252671 RepID=A0A7M5ULL8_9CNID